MTEPTAPDAPPAPDTSLEETLDRVLGKYMDRHLHRWTYMSHADAGDLASVLADAARRYFTGTAADTPSPLGLLGVLARLQDARDHALMLVTGAPEPEARGDALLDAIGAAVHLVEAARKAPVDRQAPEPVPDAGFRLRDLVHVVDWLATVQGLPLTEAAAGVRPAAERLILARRGFTARDSSEAPDVQLVAMRDDERIVAAVDPSKAGARLAVAAARLAEWAEARLIAATGLSVEVAYDAGTGTALIAEVREPLAELWLAGYNGLGDVPVPALEVPEDPAADPPLWATANAAMVELFRAVRCLPVEDVARLDQSKVLDARRSMEWVENMPTVLWPPLSIDDEEPF